MQHIAITKKSWKLIPKIVSGEKTIESRWYQTKRAPWNRIKAGEIIYFKNSGEPVIAEAKVAKVMQFEFENLDDIQKVVEKYGKKIALVNPHPATWDALPRYAILIWLTNAKIVSRPFSVDKTGFGSAAAWMTAPRFKKIL